MGERFVIKTEKGYYQDFIFSTFSEHEGGAHKFEDYLEAQQVKKALEVMDGIKEAVIIDLKPPTPVKKMLLPDEAADDIDLLNLALKYVQDAEANAAANPSSTEIQVVIVEPGKKPFKKVIPNTLDSFRDIVGGYIENLFIGRTSKDARVGIVLNEEGKIKDLPFNRRIINKRNVSDWLAGSVFITAYNMQGDNVSLSDDECDYYIRKFSSTEVYF